MTDEELKKIIEVVQKAYEEAGKKVETVILYKNSEDEGEVVIDNRKDSDLN